MPFKDGTGPSGEGPKTGRGLGPCNPDPEQNSDNPDMEQGPIRPFLRSRRNIQRGFGGRNPRGSRNRNRNRYGQK